MSDVNALREAIEAMNPHMDQSRCPEPGPSAAEELTRSKLQTVLLLARSKLPEVHPASPFVSKPFCCRPGISQSSQLGSGLSAFWAAPPNTPSFPRPGAWRRYFSALTHYFDHVLPPDQSALFFRRTLPEMQRLALRIAEIWPGRTPVRGVVLPATGVAPMTCSPFSLDCLPE